jgi:hypothetical protein
LPVFLRFGEKVLLPDGSCQSVGFQNITPKSGSSASALRRDRQFGSSSEKRQILPFEINHRNNDENAIDPAEDEHERTQQALKHNLNDDVNDDFEQEFENDFQFRWFDSKQSAPNLSTMYEAAISIRCNYFVFFSAAT